MEKGDGRALSDHYLREQRAVVGCGSTRRHWKGYTSVHIHTNIQGMYRDFCTGRYIYMHMCVCVCVCEFYTGRLTAVPSLSFLVRDQSGSNHTLPCAVFIKKREKRKGEKKKVKHKGNIFPCYSVPFQSKGSHLVTPPWNSRTHIPRSQRTNSLFCSDGREGPHGFVPSWDIQPTTCFGNPPLLTLSSPRPLFYFYLIFNFPLPSQETRGSLIHVGQ